MTLEQSKFNRKSYLEGMGFQKDMREKLSISDGNGGTFTLSHNSDDIAAAQQTLGIHGTGDTIWLQGVQISYDKAENLIVTAVSANEEIYNHLWVKYAEVDACTTVAEVDAVDWEYDVAQALQILGV